MEKKGARRRKRPTRFYPEIIVKFQEGGTLEEKNGRIYAEHLSLKKFHRTLESVKGAQARLSFRMKKDRIRELQALAGRKLKRRLPSLDLFVRVRLTEDVDVEALIKKLAEDPEVEYACLAGVPAPPPQTPDFTGQQDYQDPAPDGIDASYAWFFPGGDGAGIQVCDCEYGYNPTHEDLPGVVAVSNLDGDLSVYKYHGTSVLGVLGAVPDAKGMTGICHGATLLFASESGGHRTDCINDAIAALLPGDVLVLEMQVDVPYKPAEHDPDVHAAVSTAVGSGIVVVAAAGNGDVNLTTATNADGNFIWDPSSPDYDDSGAIIVGAGDSTSGANPHSKLDFSNYGTRVDCQGWGVDVVTTGTRSDGVADLYDGGANAKYRVSFGGTSSATAIVAGVVACLQGAAVQALGASLDPATVRALVSDPANGTPQVDSLAYPAATYPIGPLPHLQRVIRAAGIYPDVYMRDNVADTGTEPYMGAVLCWSPDIIARKNTVVNPSVDFGPLTWGDANLTEKIELGQDNYIYVRMHNRGNAPDNVTVSVYWTSASGFLHPSTWNLLDTLTADNVIPGEYRVAGPVVWPAAQVPPIGHYCLIGVVNSARDPITIPGAFSTVSDYLDFVRSHNNICYRNVDVEEVLPDAPVPPYTFLLRGLPDKAAYFRMEVRHRLPKNVKLEVELGKSLRRFERIEEKKARPFPIRYLKPKTIFKLKDYRPLIINDIQLKQNAAVPVQIRIKIPKDTPVGEYMIHADQYLGNEHLGRINYMLRVGKHRSKGKRD
jgi:hypothetical protein